LNVNTRKLYGKVLRYGKKRFCNTGRPGQNEIYNKRAGGGEEKRDYGDRRPHSGRKRWVRKGENVKRLKGGGESKLTEGGGR